MGRGSVAARRYAFTLRRNTKTCFPFCEAIVYFVTFTEDLGMRRACARSLVAESAVTARYLVYSVRYVDSFHFCKKSIVKSR